MTLVESCHSLARLCVAACSTLLVLGACASTKAGSPAVQARKPDVCGTGTQAEAALAKETADALASAPAPNADADAERSAVLSAIRTHLGNGTGHTVSVELSALRVENGWAWVEVSASPGVRKSERKAALLEKQDARWIVVETIEHGGELEKLGLAKAAAYVASLRTRHPNAPASVFPAL